MGGTWLYLTLVRHRMVKRKVDVVLRFLRWALLDEYVKPKADRNVLASRAAALFVQGDRSAPPGQPCLSLVAIINSKLCWRVFFWTWMR